MIVTHPLSLPAGLPTAYGLKMTSVFTFRHLGVGFDASGDACVLSSVHESQASGPANSGYLITRYRPDGTVAASLAAGFSRGDEVRSRVPDHLGDVCVLPGGTIAVSSAANRTYLLDPGLTRLTGAWDGDGGIGIFDVHHDVRRHHARSFAAAIRVTPSGRLLCLVSEYGARGYGRMEPNLFGVADGALTPEIRPRIEVFACLDSAPLHQDAAHAIPYTGHRGAPAGHGNRPERDLGALTAGRWPDVRHWTIRPWLGSPVVAGDDLFLVPLFDPGERRWSPYVFALVDDTGAVRGRLEGLGEGDRSPYSGRHYAVAADPVRGRIYYINRAGFHVFGRDGRPLVTLGADDKAYKPLTRFRPVGCSPSGELALLHEEHNLLLRVELPDDVDGLGPAVQAALAEHTRRRNQLKKKHAPDRWIWRNNADFTAL
ncbi:hypothetical protein [Nonomuraea sp. NPDC049480]|uniref:hypothetical protein n=1 Tax=Nonomuraea sp. NPDC049480 TaxID=3364353 RepID=UPI003792F28C